MKSLRAAVCLAALLTSLIPGLLTAQIINRANGVISATTVVSGLPLTNASFPALRFQAVASGEVDLYLVPTGKRLCVGESSVFNPSVGTITYTVQLKSGGNYYALMLAAALGTGSGGSAVAQTICLEAGESVSILTTAAGINITFTGVLFDAVNGLKTSKLTGISTGNNTLYTVPAGKTAFVLGATMTLGFNVGTTFHIVADNVTRSVYTCSVASGNALTCAPTLPVSGASSTTATASTHVFSSTTAMTLQAGDSFVINIDVGAATQLAWINVLEM